MQLTYDEYEFLHAKLFDMAIDLPDEKDEVKKIKKSLRAQFKQSYPKGFTAKEYKAHKEGKQLIQVTLELSATEKELCKKAQSR